MTDSVSVSEEAVAAYEATHLIFDALLAEVKQLSGKKPDATMSKLKVTQINRVLGDIKLFIAGEPEDKYLDILDDTTLPQIGDAVIIMAQFEAALKAFRLRHHHRVDGSMVWFIQRKPAKKR